MELSALEVKLQNLENDFAAYKKNSSEFRREIYERINVIEQNSVRTDERYRNIEAQLKSINDKLNKLSEKPAKRWDAAINSLVSAIVAGVVGFFAGRM